MILGPGASITRPQRRIVGADTRKGVTATSTPERAEPLVDAFGAVLAELGVQVETGAFADVFYRRRTLMGELPAAAHGTARRVMGRDRPTVRRSSRSRPNAAWRRRAGSRGAGRPPVRRAGQCYPSFTTFHRLGEMGAGCAHSF
jgi:hypothetical protein